jgi:hypothetical protein
MRAGTPSRHPRARCARSAASQRPPSPGRRRAWPCGPRAGHGGDPSPLSSSIRVKGNRDHPGHVKLARRRLTWPGTASARGTACRDRPAQSSPAGIRSMFEIGRADSTPVHHHVPRSRDSTDRAGHNQDRIREEAVRSLDRNQDQAVHSQGWAFLRRIGRVVTVSMHKN